MDYNPILKENNQIRFFFEFMVDFFILMILIF